MVSYIGLQRIYHRRLRDDDMFLLHCLCNCFFFGLIMVQSQTFIEDQKLQKQISYSRYFAYPFEISHRKRTRFFENFSLVFGCMVFTLFHKNNRTRTLTNFRKILKNLLPCMIFPGGKSPSLLFLLLGKYRCVCGPSST